MILDYQGNAFTLDSGHDYPYKRLTEMVQVSSLSGAGVRHVDNYQVITNKFRFVFNLMPPAEYDMLLYFFRIEAVGMRNIFNLTDDIGVQMQARFAQPALDFKLDHYELYSGSFDIEVMGDVPVIGGGGEQ